MFHKESYMKIEGFLDAQGNKMPINRFGHPIPWMNYAMLDFFKERHQPTQCMFEYGTGYSTMFFSTKVKNILSIEYNQKWFEKIGNQLSELKNADVKWYDLSNGYAEAITKEGQDAHYELILVDGRKRVECAKNAMVHLTDDGVLILDDSNRSSYLDVFTFYKDHGFLEITFSGIKPTSFRKHTTTLFYRSENCLGI